MSASPPSTMVPTIPPSTAQLAAEKLWQFQLRKENKAILEQINQSRRESEAAVAECNKKIMANEEKIVALEAKLAEMEQQQLKREQEQEKQRREQIVHISQIEKGMRTFLQERGNVSEEELRDIMAGRVSSIISPGQQDPPVASKSVHYSKDSSSRRPRPIVTHRNPEQQPLTTDAPKPPNRGNTSKHRDAQVTRRPYTSNNSRSSDRLFEPIGNLHPNAIFPRLEQGMAHMRVYYDRATEIFKSLAITDEVTEIDFVNSFIKGITTPKTKEKLLAHLQQIHPSKNKKGGIEVLCDWSDVEEALKRTGLLGEKEADSGKRKRNLNPRGRIETSFHQ